MPCEYTTLTNLFLVAKALLVTRWITVGGWDFGIAWL